MPTNGLRMPSGNCVNSGGENKGITSMQLEPLFDISTLIRKNSNSDKYPDVKPWVIKAIAEEGQKPNSQLWKRLEPSAEYQLDERVRRIRFLRKYENNGPLIKEIADRLELCEQNNRCCSGACPECGRLLQRSFVRKSKSVIRDSVDKDNHELVAITIVPSKPIIGPGNLHTLDIRNLRRRLIYALDKAGIDVAIGAFDFSFNEDKENRYNRFWSAHFYIITSVANQNQARKVLKGLFLSSRRIPRPIKISPFNNSRLRRSYAFKIQFNRRIGIGPVMTRNDAMTRKCRNTSRDKLRAAERLGIIYVPTPGRIRRAIHFPWCEAGYPIDQGHAPSNRRRPSRRIKPER